MDVTPQYHLPHSYSNDAVASNNEDTDTVFYLSAMSIRAHIAHIGIPISLSVLLTLLLLYNISRGITIYFVSFHLSIHLPTYLTNHHHHHLASSRPAPDQRRPVEIPRLYIYQRTPGRTAIPPPIVYRSCKLHVDGRGSCRSLAEYMYRTCGLIADCRLPLDTIRQVCIM